MNELHEMICARSERMFQKGERDKHLNAPSRSPKKKPEIDAFLSYETGLGLAWPVQADENGRCGACHGIIDKRFFCVACHRKPFEEKQPMPHPLAKVEPKDFTGRMDFTPWIKEIKRLRRRDLRMLRSMGYFLKEPKFELIREAA